MDRDRLVEVGVALVSRFGAKALSLTSVARQAGVARATAYRMFGGRDALVAAIMARELEQLRTQLRVWGADQPDPGERIRERVRGSLAYIREHEALQYVLRNEPEEVVRALITTHDSERPSLIEMIVDATAPDVQDDEAAVLYPDPRAGSEFMVRVVYSCMLVPDSVMSDDEIAEMVVRAVVR
ncbi:MULTISPECIES: TetR/AcrR family transcriptional regulator [Gordonia]|uniref:HTH tetR-type domain-containing protein n=2 Tax=Gordonia TaxID=2053 RepID=A0ABN3HZK5_9ACTN|nr:MULTISPECIES: TetR family transcriptional regulator [Gordonia]AUH67216.1 TetR/AcrR family transcriptional regulator [Gordonia sp. YC-JH1]KJR09486.1 TetR family transcriptional regulator [Gordonia sihwensis]KXT58408.1 TetR family transcriptional regulator [Gordonia sp. QH-12]MBY4568923.1 TetR family transcriptional regulator [Gordonia sihwensis]WFN93130.1 TetR family transcriptional regulator [Gordonia sihwensis]